MGWVWFHGVDVLAGEQYGQVVCGIREHGGHGLAVVPGDHRRCDASAAQAFKGRADEIEEAGAGRGFFFHVLDQGIGFVLERLRLDGVHHLGQRLDPLQGGNRAWLGGFAEIASGERGEPSLHQGEIQGRAGQGAIEVEYDRVQALAIVHRCLQALNRVSGGPSGGKMTSYDVIIAGAGPAGSAAATVLAGAGAKVLVLDKAVFPRDKLCAGLLTWKTVRTIGRVFGEAVETLQSLGIINHKSSYYRIRHRQTSLSEGELVYPFHFVERRTFDVWCLDRAERAGAEVRQGEGVVWADPANAVVRTSQGGEYKGKYVIGADGALSAVRAHCGIDQGAWTRGLGMGLELYLPRDWLSPRSGLHEDVLADFPTIYSGFIDAGYCWTFPHRDRVIVGICGLYRNKPSGMIRQCLEDFLVFLGLPKDHGLAVKGHPLPYGNWLLRPFSGKTLLVGDAGGLVEPFFGEGIHYALRTGEMAAEACLDALKQGGDPARAYGAGLAREIFPELVWAKRLRNVLYWFVRGGLVLPVKAFLGSGGTKLQEMVHGMRSFRFLRKLN